MENDRPPDIDAEFKLVHGPWPHWVLQLGLIKLALRTGAIVVTLCLLAAAGAYVILRWR